MFIAAPTCCSFTVFAERGCSKFGTKQGGLEANALFNRRCLGRTLYFLHPARNFLVKLICC
jgi:hypothetical protein